MYLEDKLIAYGKEDYYGFHMPGHKRQTGAGSNPFLSGDFPLSLADITEIDGFDDLHDPRGILKEEMENAARFYGTEQTIFSVNGSTASNLAAVSAAVPRGGRLLITADCHRSVRHAAYLRGIEITELPAQELFPQVTAPADPEEVRRAFARQQGRSFDAVVITSPTYEGAVSDIAAIAEIVHGEGAVLIVDEAHGAHFSRHPYFPVSAVQQGADLVVQSLHKTLPSLTQTSLLHRVTERVPYEKLMAFMDIYETSSPSYLLMASITSCIHLLEEGGSAFFDGYVRNLKALREDLLTMKNLKLLTAPCLEPSKLVISTEGSSLTGPQLYERLLRTYHLQMERNKAQHVLAMTSAADTENGMRRLALALHEIDETLAK